MGAAPTSWRRLRAEIKSSTTSIPGGVHQECEGQGRLRAEETQGQKGGLGQFWAHGRVPGRRAANRGTTAVGHTDERRKRIAEELEEIGDESLEREKGRALERLEEEENAKKKKKKKKKKKAKRSE